MIGHEDIQDELSARLDGEPGRLPDDVVEAHLAACERCRAFYERARSLKDMLGAEEPHDAEPQAVAPDLTAEILAEVETEWRRAAGTRQALLATCRVVLVVAGLLFAVWAVMTVAASGGLPATDAEAGVLAPDAQPELAAMLGQAAAVRLATAITLFFGAWRPRILPGFLVFLCACTMFNLGFAMRDLVLDLAGTVQVAGLVLYAVTTVVAAVACWLSWDAGRAGGWRMLGAGPSELG